MCVLCICGYADIERREQRAAWRLALGSRFPGSLGSGGVWWEPRDGRLAAGGGWTPQQKPQLARGAGAGAAAPSEAAGGCRM
jgi:hypothetical protein